MSSDADDSISFKVGSSSRMRIAGRPSVPTIVSPPSNERTSLLGSEDGRPPTRSFTEELDREGTAENDQSAKRVSSDVNEMSGM